MFSDQPTDRELYGYGLIEVPSYGDHCTNCGGNGNGGYPPPIIDFDMSHGSSGPMISPTPIQDVPAGLPQAAPGRGTMAPMPPASSTLVLPPHAPPAETGAPAASGTKPQSDSSTSYWPGQSIRQVSAQSPPGGADLTSQADYNTPAAAWPGSNARAVQQPASPASQSSPTSTRGAGLYEPPTGLYVPAVSNP
jgi:hypothetical protein